MEKESKKNNLFTVLWFSHPRVAIAITLVAINLLVILLFTSILALIQQTNFFNELAYIFTFTMSADGIYDFINSQDDLICFIFKIVLALIQMIIFSGALIGFTTDILQSMIDKRLNNVGKMNLYNHYVFLNWSSIGPHLIYDLSFLEGKKNIVILSDDDREDVLTSIQNVFTEHKKKLKNINLFIKNGNPSSLKHLSDVSLKSAKYIGVLLSNVENSENEKMSTKDLCALKTLFAIMRMATMANIVVEVESSETVSKIEELVNTIDKKLNERIIVFSHNSVIGHILGRAIVNSGYSNLYHHLLSYDGCEFYGIPTMDIEQALYMFNDCIPIINYDDDDYIDENGKCQADQLYILSDSRDTLGIRSESRDLVKKLTYNENINREEFSVFIFSNTGSSNFVIEELDKYNKAYDKHLKVVSYSYKDDLRRIAKEISDTKGKKKILLLSTDNIETNNQDTDVFLSALSLKIDNCIDKETEIFAEITNPTNQNSLYNLGVVSVIVTNRIISLFMVQLLTHPGSKKFYRDLISSNEDNGKDMIDLDIVKVGDLLEFDKEITFSCKSELVQSFYIASNKTRMCIGIKRKQDKEIFYLCDKMDEPEQIVLKKEDEFIIVNY